MCVKEHAVHAHLRGVCGTQERRILEYKLVEVGRLVPQTGGQGSEGVDVGVQCLSDADAAIENSVERHMKRAEETDQPRDGLSNKAQLAQDLAPLLFEHSGGRGKESEDLGKDCLAVRLQLL